MLAVDKELKKLEAQHVRVEKVTSAEQKQDSRHWGSDGTRGCFLFASEL